MSVKHKPPLQVRFTFLPLQRGAISYGRPNRGKLLGGVPVPQSTLYSIREPRILWGSSHSIRHLVEAISDFRSRTAYQGEIMLKSMSRERGGRFRPHRSHQSGRDIDIQLLLMPGVPETTIPNPHEVDWEATWELIESLIATGEVDLVFLDIHVQRYLYHAARGLGATHQELREKIQWPNSKDEPDRESAAVRNGKDHFHHIHVRFSCADNEPRCKTRSRL